MSDDRVEEASDDGVETPRRYWVGVLIVVLAILLVIGFALVTFVASDRSDPTGESQRSSGGALSSDVVRRA